jgi:dynein heavy chain
MGKLSRKVEDIDSLGFMMSVLQEIREKECSIDIEINPVMDMYHLLECNLPSGFMEKEEIDKKTVLKSNWKRLITQALKRADELSNTQIGFKKGLLKDIAAFETDIQNVSSVPWLGIFSSCQYANTTLLHYLVRN